MTGPGGAILDGVVDRDVAPTLGEIIRRQRELSAMSMRQFAELVGISNPYLSQIERGLREPSEKVVEAIARNLDVSADTCRASAIDCTTSSEGARNPRSICDRYGFEIPTSSANWRIDTSDSSRWRRMNPPSEEARLSDTSPGYAAVRARPEPGRARSKTASPPLRRSRPIRCAAPRSLSSSALASRRPPRLTEG